VVEAGAHGTPSVGFQAAGGVAESIRDGLTGLLADDPDQFTSHVATLLRDRSLRERLGSHAADYARSFTWQQTVSGFLALLDGADTVETGVAGGHSGSSARRSRPRTVVHHRRLDLFRRRLRGGVDTDAGESGQDCCDQRS